MFLLEPLWTGVSPTPLTTTSTYVLITEFRLLLDLCKVLTYVLPEDRIYMYSSSEL